MITYDQNLIKNKQSKCEVHRLLCIKGGVGTFFVRKNEKGSEKMAEITLEFDTIAAISTRLEKGQSVSFV